MPLQALRVFKLDPLHLTHSKYRLKLSAVSSVEVRIPGSLASLAHDELVKALTSGNLWVTRGVACQFDIQILFNGKQLDQNERVNLLESLRYCVRDSQLWPQLSLSASLDVWQTSVDPSPDISIHLKHGVDHAGPQVQHRAWTLDTFDIKPPDSVLRTQLERVQIQYNFSEIQKKQPRAKRIKSGHLAHDDQDVMLLDFPQGFPRDFDHENMDELAQAVQEMKGLSGLIKRCFEPQPDVDEDPDLLLPASLPTLDHWPGSASHIPGQGTVENESANESSAARKRLPKPAVEIMERRLQLHASNRYPTQTEKLDLMRRTGLQRVQMAGWFDGNRSKVPEDPTSTYKLEEEEALTEEDLKDESDEEMLLSPARRRGHPEKAITVLNAWLETHTENPYPSKIEKQRLSTQTGLTIKQVETWFYHQRRLLRKDNVGKSDDVLLEHVNGITSASGVLEDYDADDLLSSQPTDGTPSLTSRSSASTVPSVPSKRHLKNSELFILDRSAACELAQAAIQILISGHVGRGLPFRAENPPPSLSLAHISPETFSPGFREAMAHNVHFLPRVSSAVCMSLSRNAQSPSLRQKLDQLSILPPSSLTDDIYDIDGKAGTIGRLTAVVQSRLWAMMQRKLYDPADAAKLWKKTTPKDGMADDEDYPDLLEMLGEKADQGCQMTELGDFSDDEMDEFEDLLSGDEDDLLACMEQRERESVERETDEMLFGSGWNDEQADQEDECLLDSEPGSDDMLL